MSQRERILVLLAMVLGSVVLLPTTVFVLIALWPQRILVSWLLFSLVGLVTLARIAVWLIHTVTMAKVRLNEEALRPGRLYTHERLVEHEQENSNVKSVSQESWQTPYSLQEKRVSHS
jgi:hypothetical protein